MTRWTEADLDEHEQAHLNACRDLGIPYRIVGRKVGRETIPVIEGRIGSGRKGAEKGALALYAGYLAGGGDDEGDRKDGLMLAREAGLSEDELRRRASKYVGPARRGFWASLFG